MIKIPMGESRKKSKNSWAQTAVLAAVVLVLYVTGLHTEVIGFVQRGLLQTGLMNPDTERAEAAPAADYNLMLRDPRGRVVPLSEWKGKVVFLNVWATWCPPCVAEMPGIAALYRDMGQEVVFVMLSRDREFEKAMAFMERKGYEMPVYTLAGPMPAVYGSNALPTTYVIDPQGRLVLTHAGMADYDTRKFRAFLGELLQGEGQSVSPERMN